MLMRLRKNSSSNWNIAQGWLSAIVRMSPKRKGHGGPPKSSRASGCSRDERNPDLSIVAGDAGKVLQLHQRNIQSLRREGDNSVQLYTRNPEEFGCFNRKASISGDEPRPNKQQGSLFVREVRSMRSKRLAFKRALGNRDGTSLQSKQQRVDCFERAEKNAQPMG